MADLKVVKSDVDGWDVVRADEGVALTNHPTREDAEAAAHMRAQEDSISEEERGRGLRRARTSTTASTTSARG